MINEMKDELIHKTIHIVLFKILVFVAVVTFGFALWYFFEVLIKC